MTQRQRTPAATVRRRNLLLALVTAATLAGGWAYVIYLRSPTYVYRRFVAALERRDIDTIYDLTLDEEKTQFGVTKRGIEEMLKATLWTHGRRLRAIPSKLDDGGYYADAWYKRNFSWADAATGQAIPSAHRTGVMQSAVFLYKGEDCRWRLSFTDFATSHFSFQVFMPINYRNLSGKDPERLAAIRRRKELWQRCGFLRFDAPIPLLTKKHGQWMVVQSKDGTVKP